MRVLKNVPRTVFIFVINIFFFYWLNGFYIGLVFIQGFTVYLICANDKTHSNKFLILGIAVSLGPLLASHFRESMTVIGISFYSLQVFGYLMDVRWGRIQPEKSFLRFISFIIFFGNLISGPIERAKSILGQLGQPFQLNQTIFVQGLMYITLGLFKKFILAENLADYTQLVFKNPELHAGLPAVIAILFSKFFLYYDLSGYSDIVVGVSKMYGIDLTKNFNRPLFAMNISDFWKRWHISISTWIRDYIFIPLLSTPLAPMGIGVILILTFFIFGLWHGFKLTFVIYGVLQALFLLTAPYTDRVMVKIPWRSIKWFLFYVFFLALPSVLFFSGTLENFGHIMRAPFMPTATTPKAFLSSGQISFPILIFFIIVFEGMTKYFYTYDWTKWFFERSYVMKHFIVLGAFVLFLSLAKIDTHLTFVYWNF